MNLKIVLVYILTYLLSFIKLTSSNVQRAYASETKLEDENSARERRESNQYSYNGNALQQTRGETVNTIFEQCPTLLYCSW